MNYLFDYRYQKLASVTIKNKKKSSGTVPVVYIFHSSFYIGSGMKMFGSGSGMEKCLDPGYNIPDLQH
jgi:hypothetical protein